MLAACVAILPNPKEVLAVAPVSVTKFDPSPTIKLLSVGVSPAISVSCASLSCLASNWVWIADDTPSKYPSSVVVTSLTSTLPEPLDCNALDAVRLDDAIVVAPPVNVACFESICGCTALVTPSKYPSSVEVTSDTAIFCEPFEITALSAVKLSVSIVEADPVIAVSYTHLTLPTIYSV